MKHLLPNTDPLLTSMICTLAALAVFNSPAVARAVRAAASPEETLEIVRGLSEGRIVRTPFAQFCRSRLVNARRVRPRSMREVVSRFTLAKMVPPKKQTYRRQAL